MIFQKKHLSNLMFASQQEYYVQSTPLNLNRKYAIIVFELHDDSNFGVFESSSDKPFTLTLIQRSVPLSRVYIKRCRLYIVLCLIRLGMCFKRQRRCRITNHEESKVPTLFFDRAHYAPVLCVIS